MYEQYTNTMYPKQKQAFEEIIEGKDDILTVGRGGSGKSYLIEKLVEADPKGTLVLATTGCAAINIGGMTAHSALSLPLGIPVKTEMQKLNSVSRSIFKRNHPVRRLIIDESSMISPAMFDSILQRRDRFRKTSKHKHVQIVLIGDFTQLSSVTKKGQESDLMKNKYGSTNLLESGIFKEHPFRVIELNQNKRTSDPEMQLNLERVRFAQQLDKAIPYFNKRHVPLKENIPYLTTTNANVEKINKLAFQKNPNPVFTYHAKVTGNFKDSDTLMQRVLPLKKDLRVMILRNDPDGFFVNGSMGVVTDMLPEAVLVKLDNGNEVMVEGVVADNREYYLDEEDELCTRVTSSFEQIPIRQCDALTIHKAQGLTLDEAVLDLGNFVFAEGMTYVGLSRLTNLDGLYLKRKIRPNDVKCHPAVVQFHKNLWEAARNEKQV